MTKYLEILKNTQLFTDIDEKEIIPMLECLSVKLIDFSENEIIFKENEYPKFVGIVLFGEVLIENYNLNGNRNIINKVGVGELFLEEFVSSDTKKLPISVVSKTDSKILVFDFNKIMYGCMGCKNYYTKLVFNMLKIVAKKSILLTEKANILSKRSTREKILTYLNYEMVKNNANTFEIPYNRQQLSDFLFIDRSAMSSELSKLKKEGILDFDKNTFKIIKH